jgi:hypothetical protein
MQNVRTQIRTHHVALISLAIALSSQTYNSWRNEITEANSYMRFAGIKLLLQVGDLDRVVFSVIREAWSYVLTIWDPGALTAQPVISSRKRIFLRTSHILNEHCSGCFALQAAKERILSYQDEARENHRQQR